MMQEAEAVCLGPHLSSCFSSLCKISLRVCLNPQLWWSQLGLTLWTVLSPFKGWPRPVGAWCWG